MAELPLRIQRRRTRGWRAPPGTLMCTRPGKLWCPYVVVRNPHLGELPWLVVLRSTALAGFVSKDEARGYALARFRRWLLDDAPPATRFAYLDMLRGAKFLGCWCRESDSVCHTEVYLELLRRTHET